LTTNCRFKFEKSSQLFIGTHNVTLSVAAMLVVELFEASTRLGELQHEDKRAYAIGYAKFRSRSHPSPHRSSDGKEPFIHNWRGIDYRI